jgi:hypothetical protein
MKVALGSIMERAPAGRLFEAIATLTDLPSTPARRESLAENAAPDPRKIRHRAGAR